MVKIVVNIGGRVCTIRRLIPLCDITIGEVEDIGDYKSASPVIYYDVVVTFASATSTKFEYVFTNTTLVNIKLYGIK